MANINVVSLGGEKVGEFELLDDVFSGEINDALLWESVKHYRAALRQGTASTKHRIDPQPAVAQRRHGPRPQAAQL
jgi:large subunit ribosomal protein L4